MPKSKTKATSVKKSLKSNKKKKFSLKNLDFKKNWKKLSYLGLAGFLLLSSITYGGWKRIEEERANAAGNYTVITGSANYIGVIACALNSSEVLLTLINGSTAPGVQYAYNGGSASVGPWTSVNKRVSGLSASSSVWAKIDNTYYGAVRKNLIKNCLIRY